MHIGPLAQAARAALDAGDTVKALSLLDSIPEHERHASIELCALEARLLLKAGRPGRARQILADAVQQTDDPAIVTLYIASFDAPEEASHLRKAAGASFADLWRASRQLLADLKIEPAPAYSSTCRNRLYELGGAPVDNSSLKQMAAVPRKVRRAFADRRR